MKRICLVGPVDKRFVAYPLIKTLIFLGKTLVVTDDGIYRRFSEGYEKRFSFGQSDFIIEPVIDEEVLREVDGISGIYENILYITTNEVPENSDVIVYCRGIDKGLVTSDVLETLENREFTEVYITSTKLKEQGVLKITTSKSLIDYVMTCEDRKMFVGTKDTSYTNMLYTLFDDKLGIPRTTIKGLLQREE